MNVSGVFQNNNFWSDEYKIGAEYGFDDMFFVRGGYVLAPEVDKDAHIYGFSGGIGVDYQSNGFGVKFDYAYRDVKVFDAGHIFSVTLGF